MAYILLFFYLLALLFLFFFSLAQATLIGHYKKAHRKSYPTKTGKQEEIPFVTIQLPVYNEIYVVERLIDAICALNYPKNKMEIQVLDDSTDDTSKLIQKKVNCYKSQAFQILHLQRKNRQGFKAGALQQGLVQASGNFIAIFDADFVPPSDFLNRIIPEFNDAQIGMVQTRWVHLNQDYSLLTQLQAFGLNAHFSIEQVGRNHAGSFINFNGTGGVWRKSCIIDAGGWSADTLTEDLDLSYRAQLKGWKFKYLEEVGVPAELPIFMPAIKSQQYRWNKGAAETAKKHFWKIIKADLSFQNKLHAFFHLLNSSIFVAILLVALFTVPILFIKQQHPELGFLFNLSAVFFLGFLSIAYFYWIAAKSFMDKAVWVSYARTFPFFLIISMGLSLHNAIAVVEGFSGLKTPFVRTPKFNVLNKKDRVKNNGYVHRKISLITIMELFLSLYFLFGLVISLHFHYYAFALFLLMLLSGFALVFYYSVKPLPYAE